MTIRDITMLENVNTIAAAIESNGDDFDTENKLLSEILTEIKGLAMADKSDQVTDERISRTCINIENDIDDLLNMVGMNYYIRGIKMGARLRSLLSERPEI